LPRSKRALVFLVSLAIWLVAAARYASLLVSAVFFAGATRMKPDWTVVNPYTIAFGTWIGLGIRAVFARLWYPSRRWHEPDRNG